jgi:hypothetical protein
LRNIRAQVGTISKRQAVTHDLYLLIRVVRDRVVQRNFITKLSGVSNHCFEPRVRDEPDHDESVKSRVFYTPPAAWCGGRSGGACKPVSTPSTPIRAVRSTRPGMSIFFSIGALIIAEKLDRDEGVVFLY